jgi:hypothetical protein
MEETYILNIHPEHLTAYFAGMMFAVPFLVWKLLARVFRRSDVLE